MWNSLKTAKQNDLTHSEDKVIKTLIVNILESPLHRQGELDKERQMFPTCQDILIFLQSDTKQVHYAWVTRVDRTGLVRSIVFNEYPS